APPSAAVVIGFGLGIAIGAAMVNNAYYAPWGWGAWGMGWHSHSVVVVGRPWVVPPYARYPYVRPVPVPYGGYYRPKPYVYAPRNVTINNVTVNNRPGYPGYTGGVPPRPTTLPAAPPAAKNPNAPRPANPTAGQRPATAQRPATGIPDYGS